jgi:hypothetical protein
MGSRRGFYRRATFSNAALAGARFEIGYARKALGLHKTTIGGPICLCCSGRTRVKLLTSQEAGLLPASPRDMVTASSREYRESV